MGRNCVDGRVGGYDRDRSRAGRGSPSFVVVVEAVCVVRDDDEFGRLQRRQRYVTGWQMRPKTRHGIVGCESAREEREGHVGVSDG